MATITGTTSSGFSYSIPDGLKKDYRFIRAYRDLKAQDTDQQVNGATELVSAVFCNQDEERRFLNHLADENGRVPIDVIYRELGEIMRACLEDAEAKKS